MGKKKAYICKLCGELCFSRDECLRHLYERHPKEFRELVRETGVKTCPYCGWPIAEEEDVLGSYLLHRTAKMLVCHNCRRILGTDYAFAKTMKKR